VDKDEPKREATFGASINLDHEDMARYNEPGGPWLDDVHK